MTRRSPIYLIGLCAALSSPALASAVELPQPATASADQPSELAGPELVIEGRRAAASGSLNLDRSVHVAEQPRLSELQAESLPAAVAQAPGAFGQVTNRGAGSPLLRGLIGPQNLILIEGLRFNTATFRTGPNQYLATIDPSAVARVELLLGPGGVMYGSDAMGGVIGLYLPALPRAGLGAPPSARLWTQYSSADETRAVGGEATWNRGPLAVSAGGAFRDHGTLQTGQASVARASDFRQWGWHARASLQLPAAWSLQAAVLHNGIDSAGRTDDLGKGLLRTYDNTDLFGWVEARRELGTGLLRRLRLAVVGHRQREVGNTVRCTLVAKAVPSLDDCALWGQQVARDQPAQLPAGVTRHDEAEDIVHSLGALATARLVAAEERLALTLGAEAWLDQVASQARQRSNGAGTDLWKQSARGAYSDGSRYLQIGAFAHGDWQAWQHQRWTALVNAGVRAGLVSAQAPAVPTLGEVAYRLPVAAATAGAVIKYAEKAAVFANVSTGLRAPNLQETTVLGNTGDQFEVPNAELGAEQIQSAEMGLRLRAAGWSGLAAGFYSVVEDFIDRSAVSTSEYQGYGIQAADLGCSAVGEAKCQGVSRRVNQGQATILGGEIALRSPSLAGIHGWLAASWLQAESRSAGVTQPLRRSPPSNGSMGLRWSGLNGAVYVEPWARGAAAQDQLNSGDTKDLRICENPAAPGSVLPAGTCQGTAGWFTLNLRAGYRWDAGLVGLQLLRLDLDAGNLLDARYRVHGSGLDSPGRGVSATLSAQW